MRYGLTPGIELTVESNDPAAGAVTSQIGSSEAAFPITLGSVAADKFLVETDLLRQVENKLSQYIRKNRPISSSIGHRSREGF